MNYRHKPPLAWAAVLFLFDAVAYQWTGKELAMGYYNWLKDKYASALDASLRELKKDLAEHREECEAKSAETCPYERRVEKEIQRKENEISHEDVLNPKSPNHEAGDGPSRHDEVSEAANMLRNLIPGIKVIEHETEDDAFEALPEDVRLSISHLFTGTTADYEKPSLLKVGTGEGSQVYGWGLYASSKRGVAEGYTHIDFSARTRRIDNGETVEPIGPYVTFNGEDFPNEKIKQPDFIKVLARYLYRSAANDETVYDAIRNLENDVENKVNIFGSLEDRKKALEFIVENKEKFMIHYFGEYVYEQTFFTNRAPGDESHLLKWYEPVSEENAKRAIEAIKSLGLDQRDLDSTFGKRWENKLRESTGQKVYQMTTDAFANLDVENAEKSASELLAKHDIDGIKYPVDSYGGKTVKDGDKAGWNYVSFRDDNIRVDRKWKYGVEVPVAAQGGDIRLMAIDDLDGADRRSETLAMSGDELKRIQFNVVPFATSTGMNNDNVLDYCKRNGIIRKLNNDETNGKGSINISIGSINEMLNASQMQKSVSHEVHRAVAMNLPTVIKNAEVIENHADRKKVDGVRKNENAQDNGISLDVMYAAVEVDGNPYRCKIRVKRYKDKGATDKAYSYDVKTIEVEPGRLVQTDNRPYPRGSTSVGGDILLNGVLDVNGNPILKRSSSNRHQKEGKNILGWYNRKTGDVHLVKGAATAKTVLHELGWHATYQWAERNAPELHAQMRKFAEEAPDAVKEAVRKTYGQDVSPEVLLDEIGAERFTQEHAEKFAGRVHDNLDRSWWGKVKNGVRGIWERFSDRVRGMTDKGGRINVERISRMNPSDGMAALFEQMVHGRSLGKIAKDEMPDDVVCAEKMLHEYIQRLDQMNLEIRY